MEQMVKNMMKSSIVTSIVLFLLGVLLIFESENTIMTISYVIGGILIAIGVMALLRFIRHKSTGLGSDLDIIYGIVTVILGILVISNPQAIASIIPLVIGAGIVISGATKLQYAFDLKRQQNHIWKSTMVLAIVSTLCGVVLIFNPFKGAVILTKIIGIFIVCYAILNMVSSYMIKRSVQEIKKNVTRIDDDAIDVEITNEKIKRKKNTK